MRKSSILRKGLTVRAILAVVASALLLGAAFLVFTLGVSSCATSVDTAIAPNGAARLSIAAAVPEPLAAKFRRLAQAAPDTPLFDESAIRKAVAARPGVDILSLSTPTPGSVQASLSIRSLDELANSPDLRGAGIIELSSGQGWNELRVRLERGHAAALSKLFPGIDPYLMDALSPPALEEDPITTEEYRSMLASVLGESALPALDSARVNVTLTAPGTVIDYGGGELKGNSLRVAIPVIDTLVLAKPIEFWLRWKR